MKVARLCVGGCAIAVGLLLSVPLVAQGPPGQSGGPPDRETLHALLSGHAGITRSFREIPGGIESETTAADPELARRLRSHVPEMKARLEEGRPVRRWDPVFAALFERADRIRMEVEEIPGGVRVRETSEDPETTALIRAHAARVSEFVAEGFATVHEPTPLPAGVAAPATGAGAGPAAGTGPRAGHRHGHHGHGACAGCESGTGRGCGACGPDGHGCCGGCAHDRGHGGEPRT